MAGSSHSFSSRFRRRGVIAFSLFVALTAASTLLATIQPDGPSTTDAGAERGIEGGARRDADTSQTDPDAVRRRTLVTAVRSWRDFRRAGTVDVTFDPADLIAIDPTLVDTLPASEQQAALHALLHKPDGTPRLVVGHLSIGAFEPDRPYWRLKSASNAVMRAAGDDASPDVQSNPQPVRYWEPAWQTQLYGRPDALLDRLITAGYGGVYLANGEAYRVARSTMPDAEARMAELVADIVRYARRIDPQFVVMLGGAEELLTHTNVRDAIDAIAKPDLLFGVNGPGLPNDEADIAASLHVLRARERGGQPVFVAEYIGSADTRVAAKRRLEALGFIADLNASTANAPAPHVWSKVKF